MQLPKGSSNQSQANQSQGKGDRAMEKKMTVEEIVKQGYHCDHIACRKGYTRVAERGIGQPYKGRFGTGYVVALGCHQKGNGKASSQYEDIAYYIK